MSAFLWRHLLRFCRKRKMCENNITWLPTIQIEIHLSVDVVAFSTLSRILISGKAQQH